MAHVLSFATMVLSNHSHSPCSAVDYHAGIPVLTCSAILSLCVNSPAFLIGALARGTVFAACYMQMTSGRKHVLVARMCKA